MINVTGFETLFEFLGLNFRSPEYDCEFYIIQRFSLVPFRQSTIVNLVAYKAIALDFELWSQTRKEIQRVHLEHFTTLLQTSRYKRFNSRQRFVKLGLVRKLLFVLQTDWYQHDTVPFVVEALKASMQANFSKEDAIKPVVSYLAAHLNHSGKSIHPDKERSYTNCFSVIDSGGTISPRSLVSGIDYINPCEKAEQILELLVSTASVPSYHAKLAAALPLPRICLLLLGERPSSVVAAQILTLIGTSITISSSFIRKFELISGWSVLKTVLPFCWDPTVNQTAFDVLLGRISLLKNTSHQDSQTVVCPQIVPAILAAVHTGLITVATNCWISDAPEGRSDLTSICVD